MPILFDLPTDVSLSILMDWLGDTKSLVALDSASARSVRPGYLALVRDPGFVITKTVKMILKAHDVCCWIGYRGIRVREIVVLSPLVKEVVGLSRECLSAVTSLTVSCVRSKQAHVEDVSNLLNLVPSLTSLDVSGFQAGTCDYMDILATMDHLRLRMLKLDDWNTLCERVDFVATVFGNTLEVLEMGFARQMTAAILNLLGTACKNLKVLRFACCDISSGELAYALGSERFPRLENLSTRTVGPAFNDEVVLALCSSHPNLQSIHVDGGVDITLSSIVVTLTHCPCFTDLITAGFRFKTVFATEDITSNDTSKLPYYKLHTSCSLTPSWRDALDAITRAPFYKHRLRVFQPRDACFTEDVDGLIDAVGGDLLALCIVLAEDVGQITLSRLIRECTELRTLYLDNCAPFTDELVILLAEQCHHVTSLSLAGATTITDSSMNYLLCRLGRQLKWLFVAQCSQLTDTTLIAVTEYCTSLEALDITGTDIAADDVMAHLIGPDCLLELTHLAVDDETREIVLDLLREEGNKVNRRWKRVL